MVATWYSLVGDAHPTLEMFFNVGFILFELRPKETLRGDPELVWIIGAWILEFVCYLLFGACNFVFKDSIIICIFCFLFYL